MPACQAVRRTGGLTHNIMRNSILLTLAVLGLACYSPISATTISNPEQTYTEVSIQGDQVNVLPEGEVPSAELNTVQESKRLRQLQKAQNAKENDEYGGAITLIAMVIVISALLILSILFFCFGKISTAFQKSRKRMAHGVEAHNAEEHHEELDSGEAIAAIAMALAEHTCQGHDMQDTILTIRRMRKTYSPWNSKIYNLRVMPEHLQARGARNLKK